MRHTWLVGWFKVAKAKVVTPRPNWDILKMSFPRLKITFEQTCKLPHSVSNNWKRVMKTSSPVKLIWNLSFYLLSFPLFPSLFSESTRDTSPSSSSLLHPRFFRDSLRRGELLPPRGTVEILLERLQPSRIGVTVRHKDNLQQRNAIPRILGYIRNAQQGKDIITSLSPSGKPAAIKGRELRATKWRRTPACAEADRLIASTKSRRTKSITTVYRGLGPHFTSKNATASACVVVVRMNRERGSKSFQAPLLTCHTRTCTRYTRGKTEGDDPADDSNFHRGPGRSRGGSLLKHFR
ncbi:hypothetical protein ALC62_14549 [Cyphomyrmex costatus]|uniref:Uncharacterized protein n=1 Tax=Cyphomyrmex costatus TaxID=456900 RepID=A0A195C259_9HYME|nr:hypothetical protein ALC62_14549 [Cyphomyrmex costatus]